MTKLLHLLLLLCFSLLGKIALGQSKLDSLLPIRGFCIAAPQVKQVEAFVKFINEELASRQVNTLILRVDYNYQFESHPELRDSVALSKRDVRKLVNACQKNGIRIIP